MEYLVEHDLSYWPAKIQWPSLSRSNFTGEWGGGKNLPSDLNALIGLKGLCRERTFTVAKNC